MSDKIERTFWILSIQVDGRRHCVILECLHTDSGLDGPSGAQEMSHHALG